MAKVEKDSIVYVCGHCHTRVQSKIAGTVQDRFDHDELPVAWVLTRCSSCKRPNVLGREYYGMHGDEEVWGDWRIFPPQDRTFSKEVPKPIGAAFAEAQVNLRSGSYLSTALMCRRSVELLASNQGVKKGNLAVKLKALKDKDVIDTRLYEWADALRLAGNDAAHQDDPDFEMTMADAEDLAAFTEAIIDYVYIYRARFDEFRRRRKKTAKRAASRV